MEVKPGTVQQLYDRISDKQFFQMLEDGICCTGYNAEDPCPASAWIIVTSECGCSDVMCYHHATSLYQGVRSNIVSVYCDTCGTRDLQSVELLSILDFLIDRE